MTDYRLKPVRFITNREERAINESSLAAALNDSKKRQSVLMIDGIPIQYPIQLLRKYLEGRIVLGLASEVNKGDEIVFFGIIGPKILCLSLGLTMTWTRQDFYGQMLPQRANLWHLGILSPQENILWFAKMRGSRGGACVA